MRFGLIMSEVGSGLRRNFSMVVIDSIAALYRSEYSKGAERLCACCTVLIQQPDLERSSLTGVS